MSNYKKYRNRETGELVMAEKGMFGKFSTKGFEFDWAVKNTLRSRKYIMLKNKQFNKLYESIDKDK